MIVLDNASFRRGRNTVVRNVSLRIDRGEFVGLLGPNGAGKSTLLRGLLGQIAPCAGRVSRPRGLCGWVPQATTVRWDFPLTVQQFVLNGRARIMGFRPTATQDVRAARDALQVVRMLEFAHRPMGDLSGGQRQRVLIARALATSPEVVLLDEPLTGLDVPNQVALGDVLVELAAHGTTIVMATHDLGHAVDVCSRLLLLRGELIADSAVDDVSSPVPWQAAFDVPAGHHVLRTVGVAS